MLGVIPIPFTSIQHPSVLILAIEKTISEPNCIQTYAKFWQILLQKVKPENKTYFTTLLINRIQTEFEDNVNMVDEKNTTLLSLVDKLNTTIDPQERQEIEAEIEQKEYQFRRRSLGTVRFIGEMYKLEQLTSDHIMMYIESLQDYDNEEKLEYMCILLTTVGHLIDRLDKVFFKMNKTVENARPNSSGNNSNKITISSRVRFMMQNVIDLRHSHWVQTQSHSTESNASGNSASGGGGGNYGGGDNYLSKNYNKTQDSTGSSDSIEATVKKVRDVLKKLTPENCDVLLKTMTSIPMDSAEKVQSMVKLTFEKTINEPNFVQTYPKFWQILLEEFKPEFKANFAVLIINRLQTEFEVNVDTVDAKKNALQPLVDKLKTSTDTQERQEIEAEIEKKEYLFHRRCLATVRFIGEMCKLRKLTPDRCMFCVESLQSQGSEEKLEYMCELLATVGYLIDDTVRHNFVGRYRLDKVFAKIGETVKNSRLSSSDKNSNMVMISSRVRLMMQDLIYLRLSHWDQTQSLGSGSSSQLKHKYKSNSRKYYDCGGSSQGMVCDKSNSQRQNRLDGDRVSKNSKNCDLPQEDKVIDFKKFIFTKCDDPHSVKWGICEKPTVGLMQDASNNLSSAICNIKRQTTPFHSLSTKVNDAERRSAFLTSARSNSNNESGAEMKSVTANAAKEYRKQINGFIEEFLDCAQNTNIYWQSIALSTWRSNTLTQQGELIYYLLREYLHLPRVTKEERSACAAVFSFLLRMEELDKKTFGKAYDQFGEEFPDVLIDVPAGWTYVFEFLGPMLHDRLLSFEDIWRDIWNDDKFVTGSFVKAFVAHFTKEYGANYIRDLWHKEYELDHGQMFIVGQKVTSDFLDSQELKFLFDNNVKPVDKFTSCSCTTDDQKIKRLEVLLRGDNNCDLALDYINTNVNINSSFIKVLSHFLCCEYAIVMVPSSGSRTRKDQVASEIPKLNVEIFNKCCQPLLSRCIHAQEEYQVICLDTIYESIKKNYGTKTATEFIWNIFAELHECEVISEECFHKWYTKKNTEQVLRQLTNNTT